jgi:uncharacterized membrane protein YfcA
MLFGSYYGWAVLRESSDHGLLKPFALGSLIGLLVAIPLIGLLSQQILLLILATFLILSTWIQLPRSFASGPHYPWQCGLVSSFLSIFVGATRPMLLTMFNQKLADHRAVVGTVNACAALQHTGKILVFSSVGTPFFENWLIVLVLIVTTITGAWLGRFILISTAQAKLRFLCRLLITGLAIHLAVGALRLS